MAMHGWWNRAAAGAAGKSASYSMSSMGWAGRRRYTADVCPCRPNLLRLRGRQFNGRELGADDGLDILVGLGHGFPYTTTAQRRTALKCVEDRQIVC